MFYTAIQVQLIEKLVNTNYVLFDWNNQLTSKQLILRLHFLHSYGFTYNAPLKRGGFIAIAADRIAIDNSAASTYVDFLGASAAFPRGPFLIAAILKAPLISLQCIRLKGRYHIYFDSLSEAVKASRRERDELITQLTKDFAQLLQKYCLQAPLQWFNFFTFWSGNEK